MGELILLALAKRPQSRKRRKGEGIDHEKCVDIIVDGHDRVAPPLWFPGFDNGDVVVVDTAQTKLIDGLFAALSEERPMGHLASHGPGVVFFQVERKRDGWIGVRRLSFDDKPYRMYPNGRKKPIPDLIGQIVAKFHLYPGFEFTPAGKRYLKRG